MNLMDLFIKIGVKDEASKPIAKLTKAVGSGLKTAAKAGGVALTAAATGISVLTKQAISAYADYEQLVGGIETLFSNLEGTVSAAPEVLANAERAYKTAGLSANQYMETVTSFSAALIAGLEGDYSKAAQVSDMAITDMADNANKMGTSMESIQAAYQGFAKGQYQLLDNLKLGYGGTKTEMERLLKDAQKLTGVKYDISNLSDVYEAIHAIQTNLGITGTTAKEAASTISGSFGMLKASWANLLTGLGDSDADLDALFGNVVTSAETAFNNVIPVVRKALQGIGKLVGKLAPTIGKELPKIMTDILPDLLAAAEGLISGLAAALPEILMVILDNLPQLVASAVSIAGQIINGLIQALPQMLSKIWETVDKTLSESDWGAQWETVKSAASNAIDTIVEAWNRLKEAFAPIKEALQPIIDKVGELKDKFVAWLTDKDAGEGAVGLLSAAIEGVGTAISAVIDFFADLITGAADAFGAVEQSAQAAADWVMQKWAPIQSFFSGLAEIISGIFGAGNTGGFSTHTGSFARGPSAHSGSGHFAIGNDYIPYNNYPAMLHKGEAVLTAREADEWRRGNGGSGKVVNLNIYAQQLSQADMDYIVATVNRELA